MEPAPRVIYLGLSVVGVGIVAATGWSIRHAVRREWPRARALAAGSFWAAVLVLSAAWFALPAWIVSRWSASRALDAPDTVDGASSKARVLAEAISEGMNSVPHVFLAELVAGLVWIVAVVRMRAAKRPEM